MKKNDYYALERICQFNYDDAGTCFHVFSEENHPVIFHEREEFLAAMNIVAFATVCSSRIKVYTFEVMNNHFHFTISGEKEEIKSFIRLLVSSLASHTSLTGSHNNINTLKFKILRIESLENLRNVISYDNRNGSVVSPDENVFTYEWGANRFFFNREARLRHEESGRKATCREKRELFHSARLDKVASVRIVDGYVSPVCFCHIDEAESFFRNSRHYFHSVSRNIESSKDIAKSIGESLFYMDEELYSHIRNLCSKEYGCQSVEELPAESKIEIAKGLHFGYNASNKQICRLLKMDISVVSTLFPSSS